VFINIAERHAHFFSVISEMKEEEKYFRKFTNHRMREISLILHPISLSLIFFFHKKIEEKSFGSTQFNPESFFNLIMQFTQLFTKVLRSLPLSLSHLATTFGCCCYCCLRVHI
jgi:hypothetical protein